MPDTKRIALLGATGSIGRQTLAVVAQHPEVLSVALLTARHNTKLLIEQSIRFRPEAVVVHSEQGYQKVKQALSGYNLRVYRANALHALLQGDNIDLVVVALVGFAGLAPTLAALEAGKNIALANKETLVVGGSLVMPLAKKQNATIYPIDSEHSAIFQCLVGENIHSIQQLILTASGGPFRGKKIQELKHITPEKALRHPNWKMGPKVTIDSATMMNKGLELIEAHWLFGLSLEKISMVVHPESIIHSMVVFNDTSTKAQLGLPDMRVPIQYALLHPHRRPLDVPVMDWTQQQQLHFEPIDETTFQAPALCRQSLSNGGNAPCILNAANEIAVEAFLNNKIRFLDILPCVEKCLNQLPHIANPNYEDYLHTDTETRLCAHNICTT